MLDVFVCCVGCFCFVVFVLIFLVGARQAWCCHPPTSLVGDLRCNYNTIPIAACEEHKRVCVHAAYDRQRRLTSARPSLLLFFPCCCCCIDVRRVRCSMILIVQSSSSSCGLMDRMGVLDLCLVCTAASQAQRVPLAAGRLTARRLTACCCLCSAVSLFCFCRCFIFFALFVFAVLWLLYRVVVLVPCCTSFAAVSSFAVLCLFYRVMVYRVVFLIPCCLFYRVAFLLPCRVAFTVRRHNDAAVGITANVCF